MIQITEGFETWQVYSLQLVSQNIEILNPKIIKWCHNDVIIVFL